MVEIIFLDGKFPPRTGQYHSAIVLSMDNWDDYGYKTSFIMSYCDKEGNVKSVGEVKIYCKESCDTNAHRNTGHTIHTLQKKTLNGQEGLGLNYCSLGQSLLYYEKLKRFVSEEYKSILKRLNDIATDDKVRQDFIEDNGVRLSLLRSSGAEKALKEAKEIIYETARAKNDLSFQYRLIVPYDHSPSVLSFNYTPTEELPFRINVLIGKNATGKTRALAKLSDSLCGWTISEENDCFITGRPPVDKVMPISFSVFDSFRKPPEADDGRSLSSYAYLGIQSEVGPLTQSKLLEKLKSYYSAIKERERLKIWHDFLSELMEREHQDTVDLITKGQFDRANLSSGQQILVYVFTGLIAQIEKESILLFDEPELHLHPNAISNTVRLIYRLLDQFNSYAIIATHSPLVLQEIPSRYIQILDRIEGSLYTRKPDIECLGNNISDIVFHVFDVTDRESNYKTVFRKLSRTKSFDEILELFDGRLSFNAMVFLKSCYTEK